MTEPTKIEDLFELYDKRNPKKAKQRRILKENNAMFCTDHNEQAFCTKDDGTPICFICVGIKKSEQLEYLRKKRVEMQQNFIEDLKAKVASGEIKEMPKYEKPLTFAQRMKKINYGNKN
jgi:hypothetical protein